MAHRNAGKARISIVWMVVVGLLFLMAATLAFVTQSDLATEKGKVTAAGTQVTEKTAEVAKLVDERRNLSTVLGWYPRDSADPQSDPEAAKKALDDLKSTFPDVGASDKDFEKALEKVVAAYNERGRKQAELETRIKNLESELSAAQAATTAVTTEKDSTISTLRQQIADEQKNAQQRESELEGRLASVQTQVTEREGELRKTRDDACGREAQGHQQKAVDDAIAHASHDTALRQGPALDSARREHPRGLGPPLHGLDRHRRQPARGARNRVRGALGPARRDRGQGPGGGHVGQGQLGRGLLLEHRRPLQPAGRRRRDLEPPLRPRRRPQRRPGRALQAPTTNRT
jgi:septal ring factor EnvC (AmiA/AmiB activator)